MNITLFDDPKIWQDLLPLTYTRPVSGIRVGILTIEEKWKRIFPNAKIGFITEDYLSEKFPPSEAGIGLYINSSFLPDQQLIDRIHKLSENESMVSGSELIAYKGDSNGFKQKFAGVNSDNAGDVNCLRKPFDIFAKNGNEIIKDFDLITKGRKSQKIADTNTVIGDSSKIFIEQGAVVEASIFNTNAGPVYIGVDAEVMEGCTVRGPFALGEHAVLKMSAKIYGPTTIGPHSKVGGEVNNSVIFAYSNKAHDGFLGNSVIGEWCNLGADTNNSNLKNNYGEVRIFNYTSNSYIGTDLQFCGLIMGDYSKSGINTMFNTGTVVGVGANIFGSEFPPKHIPDFSWGGAGGFTEYDLEKLFETSKAVYERRGLKFGDEEKSVLKEVFKLTSTYRKPIKI